MYKLPEDIDRTFLQGDVVRMICFNSNQIYIHLESSIQIAIEGQYVFGNDDNKTAYEVYPVSSDNGMLTLLDQVVTQTVISNSRQDLSIFFENGYGIKLLGVPEYESYTITTETNRRIII